MATKDEHSKHLPQPPADAVRRAKEAEAKAKALAATYEKGGVSGLAAQQLGQYLDKDKRAILDKAQAIAAKGELDSKGIADLAGMLGSQAGLSEDQLKLIKAAGGDALDVERAASIPGLVVDKETGTISVLGLLNLDPKDPTSRVIANVVGAGYNLVAQNVNEFAFGKLYKAAAQAATHLDATRAYSHGVGLGAAGSVIAGISFWPDINNFIQQEKQSHRRIEGIAKRFAPVLDEYAPTGRDVVSRMFSVSPEANQMIVNERRRAAANHNAERFKNTVEILGRMPLFAASVVNGFHKLGDAQGEVVAAAELAKQTKPAETIDQARIRLVREKADIYEKELGMNRKDAVVQAQEEVRADLAKKKPANDAAAPNAGGFWEQLKQNALNGGVIAAAPIATMIANNLYRKRLDDMGIQTISASDMVEHLGKQLDDNPKSERFALPKGMSELGSKSANNQLRLRDYIEQIFRQHERDTHGNDATIPARFAEALHDASTLIAQAIREDKIDGRLALIELVGEQQIVRSGGRMVEDAQAVKERLLEHENKLFLKESLDPKAQLQEMGISAQTVRDQWAHWSDEERGFAAITLGAPTLEFAGIAAKEVQNVYQRYQDDYAQSLLNVVGNLAAMDTQALKDQGASGGDITAIRHAAKAAEAKPEKAQALPELMSRREIANVRQAVANIVLAPTTSHEGKMRAGEEHLQRK